jgi:hypothetical protein
MADNTDKQSNAKSYLKSWKPGQSGNPAGRPKKEKCIITMIEQYLVMSPEQLKEVAKNESLDLGHRIALNYVFDCHKDPKHTDKLLDRLYPQETKVDITSKGEQLKSSAVYNIINPETKVLMERLENVGRVESNTDLQPEPKQLSEPAIPPVL